MFSSNTFPSFTNSFFHHQEDDVSFNYQQRNDDPFISDEYLFHAYNSSAFPPPVLENFTTIKQDSDRRQQQQQQQQVSEGSGLQYCEDRDDLLDLSGCKKKLVASKKDGHSKIYTARGPRDRRVRLSIDIAQKFFTLQELLGFDKPSKTLDWLLTNSLEAIRGLVEETNHCSNSTATYESRETTISGEKKKKKQTTPRCRSGIFQVNVAKDQSRAEARARARERTKEKMLVKKLDHGRDYQNFERSEEIN